ncbi:MAG: hypothetical protein HY898_26375 [Deltaproteobacteria bacterium]|nr:hypothetical protein [Deltaproteobacteria bacterium]
MRLAMLLTAVLVPIAGAVASGCSSDEGGAGGGAGTGAEGGSGGSSAGGSGGAAGSAGGALDMYCSSSSSDSCHCLPDPNNVWGPNEGIKTCKATSVGLGHGFCCASGGYPQKGTCTCQAWGCFEGGQCTCGITNASESATSCKSTWTTCCAHAVGGEVTLCMCSNSSACTGGDTKVASCGLDQARCRTGDTLVDACSLD